MLKSDDNVPNFLLIFCNISVLHYDVYIYPLQKSVLHYDVHIYPLQKSVLHYDVHIYPL